MPIFKHFTIELGIFDFLIQSVNSGHFIRFVLSNISNGKLQGVVFIHFLITQVVLQDCIIGFQFF